MMLTVLLYESFYTITRKTLLSSVYMVDGHKYNTQSSDFAVVRVTIRLLIYSENSKFLHVQANLIITLSLGSMETDHK